MSVGRFRRHVEDVAVPGEGEALGQIDPVGAASREDYLAALGATQRTTATLLGRGTGTIARDLGAPSGAAQRSKLPTGTVSRDSTAPDGAPAFQSTDPRRQLQRETARAERVQSRPERFTTPALPSDQFRLLLADPPWQYEHVETESRAIENQYPTMTLPDICALKVPAADDAVLYLWTTPPKVAEAVDVIVAWGFDYRTCAVWDKERIGMGYYFRQQHELLLVASRGSLRVPDPSDRPPSIIRALRGPHSEKPGTVYTLLESMYPTFTERDRIELFARVDRPGWTRWPA